MKKTCLTTSVILLVTLMIVSCGGSGGKSVDIPLYAIGEASYFANQQTKTAKAVRGMVEVNHGYKRFGTYSGGRLLTGNALEADGVYFVMLQNNTDLPVNKYLFEHQFDYTVHYLLHEKNDKDNPHNLILSAMAFDNPYTPIESAYTDSYYFHRNDAMEEAKSWFETLDKQPNQPSKYNPKDEEGGAKTYKATIGKAVEFFGIKDLKSDWFLALYLDCGAVVEFRSKNRLTTKEVIGKTIDCVTDANNTVIEYELN